MVNDFARAFLLEKGYMIQAEKIRRGIQEPITTLQLPERMHSQRVREALAVENYDPEKIVTENAEVLERLQHTPFREIGQQLVKGVPLSFEQAFLGMSYVVCATNRAMFRQLQIPLKRAHGLVSMDQGQLLGPAQTFLTAMAQREAQDTLTEEEVSGMVACGMMDINLRIGFRPYILETGGMGGDKGFMVNGEKKKVINASTLSGIVLSSLDVPVMKHGSYANTSAVGSTEAVEALGMNMYQDSFDKIAHLFANTNFYFSDAHIAKTIHDLSHSPFMRHETINHIIGPMTPPVDRKTVLNKVIGVNEGVHPTLIARSYEQLHRRGYQTVGNVAVVSGLSREFVPGNSLADVSGIRPFMMLDELSPFYTLLGIVQNGIYKGVFLVKPEDFGCDIDQYSIQVVNTQEELLTANGDALKGIGKANTDYLAMNASLGLFVAEYLGREDAIKGNALNSDYLKMCFLQCKKALVSGKAASHLQKIVQVSKGEV